MESAVSNYWLAEEECRAMCEGKYENREFMDLYEAIANHYASTLFCKDQCETWLATMKGKVVEDYLPNHFHFLQFAYYQVGDIEAAVSATAAFLLLKPGDETMESNMAYYENQEGVNKYTIRPRTDAEAYKDRLDLEKEMLEFAKNEFWGEEDEEFLEEVMSSIQGDVNYLEAEPIRSSEVRLLRDKGDLYEYNMEDDLLEEDSRPQKSVLTKGDYGKSTTPGAVFGGPTVAQVTPRNARGVDEVVQVVDDQWGEDESLPIIEYDAPDGDWENPGDLKDDWNIVDFAGLTELEMDEDVIDLEYYLQEDIDEDEWIDVDGEDEEEDDDDQEEYEEDIDDIEEKDYDEQGEDEEDIDDIEEEEEEAENYDSRSKIQNDATNFDKPVADDGTSKHLEKQTKDTNTRTDVNTNQQSQTTPQLKGDPKVDFGKSKGPAGPSKPIDSSEPSGPPKSGPSASLRKTRIQPKEDDLNHFVPSPNKPINIFQEEQDLNGTNRVAADGIATPEECDVLKQLIQREAISGDGYESTPYVHTKFELFQGLTVKQATDAAKAGRLSMFYPLTYMHVAERSRQFVEEYFDLAEKGLYFSYTHLVCRTAEPDSTKARTDLSHPVHADNCQLDRQGNCHKQRPAFVWRDWSAITYLNDDFDGGEFIFAHANLSIQAEVKPKCGRIVAFSAGSENLHGVKGVINGTRCALALWFTHDSRYRELEIFKSAEVISEMYESVYGKESHDEL